MPLSRIHSPLTPRQIVLPWLLIALTILGLMAPTLSGYLWESHESTAMVIRTQQMLEVWRAGGDWQAPWLPDVAYGHGVPFFTFYAPLGYFVAAGITQLTGCAIGLAVKWSFYLTWIIGALCTYRVILCLGHEHAQQEDAEQRQRRRLWAAAGAMAFTAAPYHYSDVIVRGALAESWAFAVMPAILWAMEAMRARPGLRGGLPAWGLAGLVALMMISHNITALYGVLLIAAYALITRPRGAAGWKWVAAVGGAGVIGVALSAWFWWPALRMKDLVRAGMVDVMWGFPERLRAHGLYPKQFFMEQWGPGASRGDATDTLALNPGLLCMGGLIMAVLALRRMDRRDALGRPLLGMVVISLGLIVVSSAWMPWEVVPTLLRYIQFPWRLMLFVILLGTVALGLAGPRVLRSIHPMLAVGPFILFAIVIGPLNALKPPAYANDSEELAHYWERFEHDDVQGFYAGCAVLEYNGRQVSMDYIAPAYQKEHPAPADRLHETPGLEITQFDKQGTVYRYHYQAEHDVTTEAALMAFPGWELQLDDAPAPERLSTNEGGMIRLDLPAGEHRMRLEYTRSPAAAQARVVSGVTLLIWLLAGIGSAAWRARRRS